MSFNYLLEKIAAAPFEMAPFKHVTIENFFTADHFRQIVGDAQITYPPFASTREMIDRLCADGYKVQPFPGCIESVEDYLRFEETQRFDTTLLPPSAANVIEGYGITLRLETIRSDFLRDLRDFLNGSDFIACLLEKFGVSEAVVIETAYQKNLNHYEISPHPDTRGKAMTYMVNIYADPGAEALPIHTHLLEPIPAYAYVPELWRGNPDIDTCWVPWHWCRTVKTTNANNSITLFRPAHDTLHGVKLNYHHLSGQRNQIYGNLWYRDHKGGHFCDLSKLDAVGAIQGRRNAPAG